MQKAISDTLNLNDLEVSKEMIKCRLFAIIVGYLQWSVVAVLNGLIHYFLGGWKWGRQGIIFPELHIVGITETLFD